MRQLLSFIFALGLFSPASAQEFSGGFRAGLNFNSLDGPSEMDAQGMSLETFNRTTGFHVGATFALAFTDLFGFKADLMYSQKGGEQLYRGPAYFYLYNGPEDNTGTPIFATRDSETDVINSYIDIPVVTYFKLGKLELEGGVSAGFLVGSRASGGISYTDTNPNLGSDNIVINIDGSFLSDPSGGAALVSLSPNPPNPNVLYFPDVIAPYYNSNRDDNLYRRLDFGLVAGASYFLSSGLYLGVRYQHGLTDTTKGDNDQRLNTPSGERQFNADDEDFNRSIQASVGFRF